MKPIINKLINQNDLRKVLLADQVLLGYRCGECCLEIAAGDGFDLRKVLLGDRCGINSKRKRRRVQFNRKAND